MLVRDPIERLLRVDNGRGADEWESRTSFPWHWIVLDSTLIFACCVFLDIYNGPSKTHFGGELRGHGILRLSLSTPP